MTVHTVAAMALAMNCTEKKCKKRYTWEDHIVISVKMIKNVSSHTINLPAHETSFWTSFSQELFTAQIIC